MLFSIIGTDIDTRIYCDPLFTLDNVLSAPIVVAGSTVDQWLLLELYGNIKVIRKE